MTDFFRNILHVVAMICEIKTQMWKELRNCYWPSVAGKGILKTVLQNTPEYAISDSKFKNSPSVPVPQREGDTPSRTHPRSAPIRRLDARAFSAQILAPSALAISVVGSRPIFFGLF